VECKRSDEGFLTFVPLRSGVAVNEGLDSNQWFGNVDILVAKDVGQETVQYVRSIYKYSVADKLTLDDYEAKK
jgi:hypothetical protein